MVHIPPHGLREVPRECMRRPPPGHSPKFPAVDGVACDMARPVRDTTDVTAARSGGVDDRGSHLPRGLPLSGPDVERLPVDPALTEESEQGRAMILYVDPFPFLRPRPIDGKGEPCDGTNREQWDRLLRMLVWSEVVHAAGDYDRQSVRRVVRIREAVRSRLARRIRSLKDPPTTQTCPPSPHHPLLL